MPKKYVNDKHRENAARLRELEKELGITSTEDAASEVPDPEPTPLEEPQVDPVPAESGQVEETDVPPTPPVAAGDEPSVETIPAPVEDKHNWEKRRQDAQEAQRRLSKERERVEAALRELEERKKADEERQKKLDELLAKLEHATAAPTPKQPEPAPAPLTLPDTTLDGDLAELERDLYDVARLTDAKARKLVEPLYKKLTEFEELERKRKLEAEEAELQRKVEAERARVESMLAEIQGRHPDALDVARDPEFQDWIEQQPPSWKDIIVNTWKYSSKDAIFVLDQFKQASAPAPEPPNPKPRGADARPRVRTTGSDIKPPAKDDVYTPEQIRDQRFMNDEMRRDLKAYRAKLDRTLKTINLATPTLE